MGRVVAETHVEATGWGEELGVALAAFLMPVPPTPKPSPRRHGGAVLRTDAEHGFAMTGRGMRWDSVRSANALAEEAEEIE